MSPIKSAKWVKIFCLAIKSLILVELIGSAESPLRGVFVQKSGLQIYRNDTIVLPMDRSPVGQIALELTCRSTRVVYNVRTCVVYRALYLYCTS